MKFFSLLIVFIASGLIFAQETKVKVSGMVFNSGADSVYISQLYGQTYIDHRATPIAKDGSFAFDIAIPNPDYYVLRFNRSHLNIILRDGSDIQVYGDGANINQFANFIGSDESQAAPL